MRYSQPDHVSTQEVPEVSIIIPCLNEQSTIHLLLEAIHSQSFPLSEMEVIISDGMSTDDTRKVIEDYQANHPRLKVRIVDNHQRTIPSSLNRGIMAASGRYIVRLDAHSIPDRDYVNICVKNLKSGKGDNVGGVWEIHPGGDSLMAKAISLATSHPLGAGDARYRLSSTTNMSGMPVETVPFGSYRRTLFDKIGKYDEKLLANEDYEFNARLRQSGGIVWLDPAIRSIYFSRNNIRQLSKQYWRYGYWKWHMIRQYPATLRWRQALPPLFVLSLIFLILLTPFRWARLVLGAELVVYLLALSMGILPIIFHHKKVLLGLGVLQAIVVMHFCWGVGFLWSMVSSLNSLINNSMTSNRDNGSDKRTS